MHLTIEKTEEIKKIEELRLGGEYDLALRKINAVLQSEQSSEIEKI